MKAPVLGSVSFTLFALGLVAVVAPSCSSAPGGEVGCPVIATCGGNPLGSWHVDVSQSCQAPVQPPSNLPPAPTGEPATASPQNPTQAKAVPSMAVGNWCSELVYEPGDVSNPIINVNPYHGAGSLTGGTLLLNDDHSYAVSVLLQNTTTNHFAPVCFDGVVPDCNDFGTQLLAFENAGMPNFQNFDCSRASDGGCDCTADYHATQSDTGYWQTSGNNLYFFSSSSKTQPMMSTVYCVGSTGSGGSAMPSLTVTGLDGEYLLSTQGLRTLTFQPGAAGM